MGPINYAMQVQSPFEGQLAGIKLGATLADMESALAKQAVERQAAQQAMARQQAFGDAVASYFAKPDRTFQDLAPALAMAGSKEQLEALKAVGEGMSKEQQQVQQRSSGQLLVALETNPEIAKAMLQQRVDATADPMEKSHYASMLKLAETDPKLAAQGIELAGGAQFGKDWIDNIAKARQVRREEQLAPFTLRKETAEATIKEAEARLAPDRFLANLDLTREQINQARAAQAASRAAAAASGAEARRKDAEAAQLASGIIPLDKRPEQETKFRKEYTDLTKGYQEVKSAYGRVLSSQDNAVGDLSLIFAYMKMLDPGSVVREGEFATAQNAAGVPERVQNIYNRVIAGTRLSEGQRKAFKGQAEGLFKQAGQQEATVRTGLERIAKGYGLNTANIFLEPVESAPTAPPAPAPRPGAPAGQPGALQQQIPGYAPAGVPAAGVTPGAASIRSQADAIIRGGR